ncbi:hypothetical protein [Streptomyces sp. NPDC048357]|uniref:hypothetical protein n=1 Tax=Streptomyces sp. NPDC048357 TaxID=3154719 RepID=UPI003435C819
MSTPAGGPRAIADRGLGARDTVERIADETTANLMDALYGDLPLSAQILGIQGLTSVARTLDVRVRDPATGPLTRRASARVLLRLHEYLVKRADTAPRAPDDAMLWLDVSGPATPWTEARAVRLEDVPPFSPQAVARWWLAERTPPPPVRLPVRARPLAAGEAGQLYATVTHAPEALPDDPKPVDMPGMFYPCRQRRVPEQLPALPAVPLTIADARAALRTVSAAVVWRAYGCPPPAGAEPLSMLDRTSVLLYVGPGFGACFGTDGLPMESPLGTVFPIEGVTAHAPGLYWEMPGRAVGGRGPSVRLDGGRVEPVPPVSVRPAAPAGVEPEIEAWIRKVNAGGPGGGVLVLLGSSYRRRDLEFRTAGSRVVDAVGAARTYLAAAALRRISQVTLLEILEDRAVVELLLRAVPVAGLVYGAYDNAQSAARWGMVAGMAMWGTDPEDIQVAGRLIAHEVVELALGELTSSGGTSGRGRPKGKSPDVSPTLTRPTRPESGRPPPDSRPSGRPPSAGPLHDRGNTDRLGAAPIRAPQEPPDLPSPSRQQPETAPPPTPAPSGAARVRDWLASGRLKVQPGRTGTGDSLEAIKKQAQSAPLRMLRIAAAAELGPIYRYLRHGVPTDGGNRPVKSVEILTPRPDDRTVDLVVTYGDDSRELVEVTSVTGARRTEVEASEATPVQSAKQSDVNGALRRKAVPGEKPLQVERPVPGGPARAAVVISLMRPTADVAHMAANAMAKYGDAITSIVDRVEFTYLVRESPVDPMSRAVVTYVREGKSWRPVVPAPPPAPSGDE